MQRSPADSLKAQYRLAALDKFQCLGGDCPDSCCTYGWAPIPVEDDIYQKWRNIADPDERQRLLNNTTTVTDGAVTKIQLARTAGRCHNLTGDGLCSIHFRHGQDFLPVTCREYPRYYRTSESRELRSAMPSCPEIARLVLFEDEGTPLFRRVGAEASARSTIHAGTDLHDALDILVGRTLDQRKYSLNVRITCLAKVLVELAERSAQGILDRRFLRRLHSTIPKSLYELNLSIKTRRLRPDPFTAGSFWSSMYLFAKRVFDQDAHFDPGKSPLAALLTAPLDDKAKHYEEIYELVKEYREYASATVRHYDGAFERYLRVSFMNRGFPWRPVGENQVATFINCIVPFAAIQLFLWLRARAREELTPEDVVEAVYKIERVGSHGPGAYNTLQAYPHLLRIDRYYPCLVDIY